MVMIMVIFKKKWEFNAYCEKDEDSYDPFGIYDTLAKMNEDVAKRNKWCDNVGVCANDISTKGNNNEEGKF